MFSLSAEEYGIKITLTAELLPVASASFAPLGGLDDEESSEVCNAVFQASAAQLAALVSQSLEQVSQHGFHNRARILSDQSTQTPSAKDS